MSAPAAIIECVPVVTGAVTTWTFFRTDVDSAGKRHGRCRLAEFSSAASARRFGIEACTGNVIVKGLDHIEDPAPSLTLTEAQEW